MPRRLWPLLLTAPSTFGPAVNAPGFAPAPLAAVLPATIVFSNVTLAGPTRMPPPVPSAASRGGLLAPPWLTPVLPACALFRLNVPCLRLIVAALLFVSAPPCASPPAPWLPQLRPPAVWPPLPPLPPVAELLANVAVLMTRLPLSAKIAPPRAAPPSPAICPPRQVVPKALPPSPPLAAARLKVELVTVTLP